MHIVYSYKFYKFMNIYIKKHLKNSLTTDELSVGKLDSMKCHTLTIKKKCLNIRLL